MVKTLRGVVKVGVASRQSWCRERMVSGSGGVLEEPSTISLLFITLPGSSCTLLILLIHSFFFNMQYNNTFSYFHWNASELSALVNPAYSRRGSPPQSSGSPTVFPGFH